MDLFQTVFPAVLTCKLSFYPCLQCTRISAL